MKAVPISSVIIKAAVPTVFKEPSLTAVQWLVLMASTRASIFGDMVTLAKAHVLEAGRDKRWSWKELA